MRDKRARPAGSRGLRPARWVWAIGALGAVAAIALAAVVAPEARGQIPGSDIFLVSVERGPAGPALGSPENLTQRPGYDNQPAWLPAGEAFLYTSIGDDAQADIYRFDLATRKRHRVTETAEAEYSPTPLATGGFSCVRVELDSLSTQRLWEFDAQGTHPRLVLPDVTAVGYHAWATATDVVLFLVGEPHVLHRARRGEPGSSLVAADIDRSLQRVPTDGRISFVQRLDNAWWIRLTDAATGEVEDLFPVAEGAQDLVWTPWGSVWMTSGSRILERTPGGPEGWTLVADLAPLSGLTRMALDPSGTRLLLVAAEAEAPDADTD